MEIFSKGLKKDGNFKGDGYISQGGGGFWRITKQIGGRGVHKVKTL